MDHHSAAVAGSENSDNSMAAKPSLDKETGAASSPQHLETIRTVSRVPGNTHYYEKDGLRTYGDDEDHDHEPPVRFSLTYNSQLGEANI
jgi:hypothetical protein